MQQCQVIQINAASSKKLATSVSGESYYKTYYYMQIEFCSSVVETLLINSILVQRPNYKFKFC